MSRRLGAEESVSTPPAAFHGTHVASDGRRTRFVRRDEQDPLLAAAFATLREEAVRVCQRVGRGLPGLAEKLRRPEVAAALEAGRLLPWPHLPQQLRHLLQQTARQVPLLRLSTCPSMQLATLVSTRTGTTTTTTTTMTSLSCSTRQLLKRMK